MPAPTLPQAADWNLNGRHLVCNLSGKQPEEHSFFVFRDLETTVLVETKVNGGEAAWGGGYDTQSEPQGSQLGLARLGTACLCLHALCKAPALHGNQC